MSDQIELATGLAFQDPNAGPALAEPTLFAEGAAKQPEPFFAATSKDAVPVIERLGADHVEVSLILSSSVGPVQLFGRRTARRSLTVACPTSYTSPVGGAVTPTGFQFAHQRSLLDAGVGFQVNPGDSALIDSEGPVWVAVLPGASSAVVQAIETFDAAGGPVG